MNIGNAFITILLVLLYVGVLIDCAIIMTKHNEKTDIRIKELEHEREVEISKIRKERQKKEKENGKAFVKSQNAKGLVLYKKKWLPKKEYVRAKKYDDFFQRLKDSNEYKGCHMVCKTCGYVWKVKKDYGLPARCGKCNSENIGIDKEKTYYG